jgi:hypothetical protein
MAVGKRFLCSVHYGVRSRFTKALRYLPRHVIQRKVSNGVPVSGAGKLAKLFGEGTILRHLA